MFSKCLSSLLNRQFSSSGILRSTILRSTVKNVNSNGCKRLTIIESTTSGLHFVRSFHRNEFKSGLEKVAAITEDADGDALSSRNHGVNRQWIEAADIPDEKIGSFDNFRLSDETIAKLKSLGIPYFFPVQSNTFDSIYDGFDVIVQARTGSGKTMSYAIPLIEKLSTQIEIHSKHRIPKMLVLTPTRELANQVSSVVSSLSGRLKVVAVYGGANISSQEVQLRRGADIIVGTPGRILDLISRRSLDLTQLNHVVLDEVDRMLDMGFANDVDDILKNRYRPDNRDSNPQTLLFSATVPNWVQKTAKKYLSRDIRMIDLIGKNTNKTAINVKHTAMLCSVTDRINAIVDILTSHIDKNVNNTNNNKNEVSSNADRSDPDSEDSAPRIIVFCQTKREVDQMGASKRLAGKVAVTAGDVSQMQREISLKKFKNGDTCCLIATDVAARGLDIPDVDVVVQCSPPQDVESYIHRSGRTGRAGKSGESIMLYTPDELDDVVKVEQVAGFTFNKVQFQRSVQNMKQDVLRSINNVGSKTRQKFETMATELAEEIGMDKLLTSALAVICGLEQKSLITFTPGLTTFHMTMPGHRITSRSEVWSTIRTHLPANVADKARNIRICSDYEGFVFDMPSYEEDVITKNFENNDNHVLTIPDQLPPIIQSENRDFSRSKSGAFSRSRSNEFSRSRSYANNGDYNDGDDDNDNNNNRYGSYSKLSHSFDRSNSRYSRGKSFSNNFNNNYNFRKGNNRGGGYEDRGEFVLNHRRGLMPHD